MRVDGKCGLAKGFVHDHIRGFAPDARQAHQRGAVLGYSAVKLVAQHNRQGINIFCFVAIKPNGFNIIANVRFTQRSHFFRAVGPAEQRLGCPVDALVGCLRLQNNSDQKRKIIGVSQFGLWCRVCGGNALKKQGNAGFFHARHFSVTPAPAQIGRRALALFALPHALHLKNV